MKRTIEVPKGFVSVVKDYEKRISTQQQCADRLKINKTTFCKYYLIYKALHGDISIMESDN